MILLKTKLSLLLLLRLIIAIQATPKQQQQHASKMANPWITSLRNLLEDCPVKSAKVGREQLTPSARFVRALADCARRRAVMAIDDILDDDVIPIFKGFALVRYKEVGETTTTATFSLGKLLKHMHDQQHNQQQLSENEIDQGRNWRERLTSRVARVLKTHAIKIDVDRLEPVLPEVGAGYVYTGRSGAARDLDVEGRGPMRRRRRRQMQMMPLIMMAVLLMGSVLIPMGFQFLAVLGGKALLLAKMALMLSSIQGLKKIATNGVNYGLYHQPVPEAWHERGSSVPFDVAYAGSSSALASVAGAPGGYHPSGGYLDGGSASTSYSLGHFRKRSSV